MPKRLAVANCTSLRSGKEVSNLGTLMIRFFMALPSAFTKMGRLRSLNRRLSTRCDCSSMLSGAWWVTDFSMGVQAWGMMPKSGLMHLAIARMTTRMQNADKKWMRRGV